MTLDPVRLELRDRVGLWVGVWECICVCVCAGKDTALSLSLSLYVCGFVSTGLE